MIHSHQTYPPPTSRVGAIEDEGIDLGSAKNDLNNMFTVPVVNTAFASSEQKFKIFVVVIVVDEVDNVKKKEEERKKNEREKTETVKRNRKKRKL